MPSSQAEDDRTHLRLCILKQWPDFPGYGFDLRSKSGRPGHFVEGIDDNSPAYHAGLKNSDKIIEVNGENTTGLQHVQVAELIKTSVAGEVSILVADSETEKYFKEVGLPMDGKSDRLVTYRGPLTKPPKIGLSSAVLRTPEPRARADSAAFTRYSTPEPPVGYRPPRPTDVEVTVTGAPGEATANGLSVRTKLAADDPLADAPTPRLCHLVKAPNQSFGFNLRTYNDNREKVIVRLDGNSVAERSGVLMDDVIIEIDGVNVGNENHEQVSARLKGSPYTPGEVKLLLVTQRDLAWYRKNKLVPRSTQPNVEYIRTVGEGRRVSIQASALKDSPPPPAYNGARTSNGGPAATSRQTSSKSGGGSGHDNGAYEPEVGAERPEQRHELRQQYSSDVSSPQDDFLLNLTKVTVPEMRAKLANTKQEDPRREPKDPYKHPPEFDRKHKVLENMI